MSKLLYRFAGKSTGPNAPSARFTDIGARRAEEEQGLMSGIDDEEML